jgi:predicted acyl esterase
VAKLKPPSLKAILPWEGRADQYRDQAYHGGIFSMGFIANWVATHTAHHLLGRPRSYNPDSFQPDMLYNLMKNDLDSQFWRIASADWDETDVPLYSVGNWGGFALHLRGNTEGFTRARSRNKKLRIHTGTHFHPFHSEEGRLDQLRWFDHWLKGIDTGIMDEPPVKLEIRTGGSTKPYAFRFENEWPIARTQWTKLYLKIDKDAPVKGEGIEGSLVDKAVKTEKAITYSAGPGHYRPVSGRSGVSFETPPMTVDTEVTGPLVLNLWVSSSSEDMDIYATIRNIDAEGKDVHEVGQRGEPVGCVTKGWLRASHRKLDEKQSLPYRPYHAHDERWWLEKDQVVECQVEIWPTSMVFKKGHKLRLDITPRDGVASGHFTHYNADYNSGATNRIHSGGDKLSWLMLPVIPPKS